MEAVVVVVTTMKTMIIRIGLSEKKINMIST
jgi:hypothetical protein